ncbi:MAG: HD domain-containing protein [Ruminococcaceae bacterium]|nr:HD domain-containing protein [Oscillospiraceae bacterium]
MCNNIINNTIEYIKGFFASDFTGHDSEHSMRVYKIATKLAVTEGADMLVTSLSALLHDVDDKKISPDTADNLSNARTFLSSQGVDDITLEKICDVIKQISFKGKDSVVPDTIEGKCVQDADRLDALGAVGIARAFAYGGANHRVMYDPEIKPVLNMSEQEYYSAQGTTVNQFYEKLFLLKDIMNTESAKVIASQRDTFMRSFIDEFLNEWNM